MQKELLQHIESQELVITQFLDIWKSTKNLDTFDQPTGAGHAEDLVALEYMIYENIITDMKQMVPMASAIISQLLINYADFDWHYSDNTLYKGVVLKHNQSSVIVPVFELCLFKASSQRNQLDEFPSDVYFDVLFSCVETMYTHPLMALSLISFPNDQSYHEVFGYTVPNELSKLYNLYAHHDEEFLIRALGFSVYPLLKLEKWDELMVEIKCYAPHLKSCFGKDWQQRAIKESNILA